MWMVVPQPRWSWLSCREGGGQWANQSIKGSSSSRVGSGVGVQEVSTEVEGDNYTGVEIYMQRITEALAFLAFYHGAAQTCNFASGAHLNNKKSQR